MLATARRYGVDLKQAEPVRAHAVQLFRDLKALHQMPVEYESWLAAAAMLRDTGKFINHQGHHRHTQYIVSSSEIYGYTQLQRTIVSALARYLGKSRPQPGDRALRNIPADEHKHVHRAVVLLRLAVALNQDRAIGRVAGVGQGLSEASLSGGGAGPDRGGAGALEAAQGGRLLPRGLWAGAFSHAGVDGAGHARIDEPAQQGRMAVEVDAGDGALAHADGCAAVAGDEAAQKLEHVGVVADDQDAFAVGIFGQHLLEVGVVSRLSAKCRADLDFGLIAQLRAHKLRGLQGALEGAGDDDIDLHLEGAQGLAPSTCTGLFLL